MKLTENIDSQIEDRQTEVQALLKLKSFVESKGVEFWDKLPTAQPLGYNTGFDFNNLTHEQVMTVIKAFPGKWTKEPGFGATIHYSIRVGDINVRCYSGQPPPNCKIEYEDVHVPARTERRAKLVCQEAVVVPVEPTKSIDEINAELFDATI